MKKIEYKAPVMETIELKAQNALLNYSTGEQPGVDRD
jgi:hypothetical protein